MGRPTLKQINVTQMCTEYRAKCRERKHSSDKFVNTNSMQHPKKMQDAIEEGEGKQYELGLCVIR